MASLRERMIEDMELAGLSPRTRQAYTQAVKRLAMHYRRRPDRLDEEAVRAFLVGAIKCRHGARHVQARPFRPQVLLHDHARP